ncbi:NADH-quinone oxidoreductase subunit NuoE [Candidatus Caldatribacterium sp.]|uniref:NADH-quinone oxidoreductase subunit NuoE n=1 Tax=Candidatus Caldatribacterium sp. TaxID=2282143 RepID=UPI002991451A|nr:NADH-quinone oxidoreductase subunit NuoE [Candidatus Caldatribacterium sp.]MDW8080683.1 NADH-quinone oxidoreductase subunit NuoE [Candidatus Calescibacterium sp.]
MSLVYQDVEEIIVRYHGEETPLLCILEEIQEKWGYLPRDVLGYVARRLGIPSSTVYGVATFYAFLSTQPVGKYVIRVCRSTPCHVRGAVNVLEALKKELGIREGETTKDGKFTLEVTSCLGVCGVAPAMMINNVTYGNLTEDRIREVLAFYRD